MSSALVCLHGWGGTKESFVPLRAGLSGSGIDIYTPDLPGFGSESEPAEPWNVDQYAEWVEQWIQKNVPEASDGILLLGHSHGGRIAIKIAVRGSLKIDHLFLCAPAGIKHPRHIKRIIGLTLAKSGKAFLKIPGFKTLEPLGKKVLYKLVRVHDYEKASPVMRQTMIEVVKEDLRPLLKEISVPTDLFWGTADGMTPYSDALVMQKEIPHVTLHTFEGIRHSVHKDKAREIAEIIRVT